MIDQNDKTLGHVCMCRAEQWVLRKRSEKGALREAWVMRTLKVCLGVESCEESRGSSAAWTWGGRARFFFSGTRFLCVALVPVLEPTLWTRLALNSQRTICLCLPSAGIKGLYHHRQTPVSYLKHCKKIFWCQFDVSTVTALVIVQVSFDSTLSTTGPCDTVLFK